MVTLSTDQIKKKPELLIEQLDAGQEVMIVRDSQSIAHVFPTTVATRNPVTGSSNGEIVSSDALDESTPVYSFAELLAEGEKVHAGAPIKYGDPVKRAFEKAVIQKFQKL